MFLTEDFFIFLFKILKQKFSEKWNTKAWTPLCQKSRQELKTESEYSHTSDLGCSLIFKPRLIITKSRKCFKSGTVYVSSIQFPFRFCSYVTPHYRFSATESSKLRALKLKFFTNCTFCKLQIFCNANVHYNVAYINLHFNIFYILSRFCLIKEIIWAEIRKKNSPHWLATPCRLCLLAVAHVKRRLKQKKFYTFNSVFCRCSAAEERKKPEMR